MALLGGGESELKSRDTAAESAANSGMNRWLDRGSQLNCGRKNRSQTFCFSRIAMARCNTNPFPGMNPWLEMHWGDLHSRLTTYACDHLQSQLPDGLRARIEEYVTVEGEEDTESNPRRRFAPDVRVLERPNAAIGFGDAIDLEGGGTAVAVAEEPLIVSRRVEPETLHYIKIIDLKSGHRVVTAIEFLSPSNKISDQGQRQFREKQETLLAGNVNLVEIDLLRDGDWVISVPKSMVPKSRREPYRVNVVRADRSWDAEVYRVSLRHPLPTIRIPLRPTDADVSLPLQTLLTAAFVNGRYQDELDYSQPLDPALSPADAAWTTRLLQTHGCG